jgi:4-amino-4-deoxy-L-arabinose transferase-like glycosyltransferase
MPPMNLLSVGPDFKGLVVFTAPLGWTIAAVALSALLWVLLRAKGWGAAAGWTALACAGQACMLQLFDVGTRVRPQVFYGWSELLPTWRAVFLLALGAQALVVTWGAWRHLRPGLTAVRRTIPFPALLVVLSVMAYASATIAPEVAQTFVHGGFLSRLAMHASKIALGMVMFLVGGMNLALAAATLPDAALEELKKLWETRKTSRLVWVVALWVVMVASLLAWVVLERMPHVPDEATYIFQARYLAEGKLYLPTPPEAKAISLPFVFADGAKWYSVFPAGWAVLLAVGAKLGVPWLINPLLGGLVILLAHALVRRLYDREIADATTLLLGASPWLLFMSANFMAHTASLAFGLLGLLGVARAKEEGSVSGAALAGLAFGGLLHIRPLEAVIVAGVAGIWWLSGGWKKLRLAALIATMVTGLAMTGLFLAYNKALTGSATRLPLDLWADTTYGVGSNRLGFGKDIGSWGWTGLDALPGHGAIDVVMNTNQNLHLVNFEQFGWACGSLLFVFLLPLGPRKKNDGLMWGLVAGTVGGLSLYWFSGGPDFGARYWYQLIVPLAVLTVRGAMEFAPRLNHAAPASATGGGRVWAFVLLASALGTLNVVPWRALDKYHHYRGVRPELRALAEEKQFGRSLVIVCGKLWPDMGPVAWLGSLRFERESEGTIYALDLGPASRERLRSIFADRPVWVVGGGGVNEEAARILAGPIAPGQPLPALPELSSRKADE